MGQRADRVGHEGQETPGDEFAQGRGWNAGDEEDPTMRNEPGLAGLEDDISDTRFGRHQCRSRRRSRRRS